MGWLPRVYLLGSIAGSLGGFIIHQTGTSPGCLSGKTKSSVCVEDAWCTL